MEKTLKKHWKTHRKNIGKTLEKNAVAAALQRNAGKPTRDVNSCFPMRESSHTIDYVIWFIVNLRVFYVHVVELPKTH